MDHSTGPHGVCQFLALILVGVALVAYAPRARAQGATGAINGTVADSTGAVIPKAQVALTNNATGAQRLAVTNDTGNYVFPEVAPGLYTIVVTADGFATAREEKFTLNVNQTATHNFTLSVGTTNKRSRFRAPAPVSSLRPPNSARRLPPAK